MKENTEQKIIEKQITEHLSETFKISLEEARLVSLHSQTDSVYYCEVGIF